MYAQFDFSKTYSDDDSSDCGSDYNEHCEDMEWYHTPLFGDEQNESTDNGEFDVDEDTVCVL